MVTQNPAYTRLPVSTARALVAADLATEGSYVYPLDDGVWCAVYAGWTSSETFPTREAASAWIETQSELNRGYAL